MVNNPNHPVGAASFAAICGSYSSLFMDGPCRNCGYSYKAHQFRVYKEQQPIEAEQLVPLDTAPIELKYPMISMCLNCETMARWPEKLDHKGNCPYGVEKKPSPVQYTIKEGGEWRPWSLRHFDLLQNNNPHAIQFADGSIFDFYNGWRPEE